MEPGRKPLDPMMAANQTRRFLLLAALGCACLAVLWVASRAPAASPEKELALATSITRPSDSTNGALGSVTPNDHAEGTLTASAERSALEATDEARAAAADRIPSVARLRIVDRTTDEPIVGATVTRVWAGGDRLRESKRVGDELAARGWVSAPSGDDGLLELRWAGSPVIDVRVEADGYVQGVVGSLAAALPAQPGSDKGDVARRIGLVRATRVVVEPIGFPVDVEGLVMLFEDGDARGRKPDQQVPWKGEPTVTFEGVEPGRVSVVLAVQGHPLVARQSIAADPGEEVRVELRARRGEVLRGRVVERTTRQPLAGIEVRARPELSGVSPVVEGAGVPVIVSGSDGSFLIEGLAPGRVRVELTPPYGPSVTREVIVIEGEATRTRELAIAGAAALSGRVLVPEGVSPGTVQVAVMSTGEVASLRIEDFALKGIKGLARRGAVTRVAADGSFRFDTVTSGRSLSVVASSPAGVGVALVGKPLDVGEERRNVEVTITQPERVTFRVVDSNAVPVETARVSLRWIFGGRGLWTGASKEDGVDGLYTLGADAETVRRIKLNAEGFLPFNAPWPVIDGTPERQPVFTLTRSATIEVFVQDTAGLAVRRARVTALPEDLDSSADGGGRRRWRGRSSSLTDSFGRATLTLEGGERWVVSAGARGYMRPDAQTVDAAAGTPGSSLAFLLEPIVPPEPATVVGTLVRQGTGAPLPAVRFDGLRNGSAEIDGATFRLVGLRPGRVTIVAHAVGFESVKIPIERLAAGEVRDVGEIRTRGATRVDVIIRDKDGKLVRDARVRLFRVPPEDGGRAGLPPRLDFPRRPDGSGKFRKSAVARVKWRLVVDNKRSKRFTRTVAISGATKTIKVVLEPR